MTKCTEQVERFNTRKGHVMEVCGGEMMEVGKIFTGKQELIKSEDGMSTLGYKAVYDTLSQCKSCRKVSLT